MQFRLGIFLMGSLVVLLGATEPTCTGPMEIANEGEECGDDIDTKCDQGLYCAFGEVRCGTPPVIGVCRPMGSCGNEYDCQDENNIWYAPECEGDIVCQDNLCGVDCHSEPDCFDLSVEECEANGCEVFYAHPYDQESDCYLEELQPVFCSIAIQDIPCASWEEGYPICGHPIIMTDPDETSWYAGWFGSSKPEDWTIELIPEDKSTCGE
jgi:hypothetical protein